MTEITPTAPEPAAASDWRAVLDAAIASDPRRKLGVALRLGVSRVYVSRVSTGHIPVASPRFIARVMALLAQVDCPHLGVTIASEQCRSYAARDYARIAAHEVPHWRACRACERNPERIAASAGLPASALSPAPEAGTEGQP